MLLNRRQIKSGTIAWILNNVTFRLWLFGTSRSFKSLNLGKQSSASIDSLSTSYNVSQSGKVSLIKVDLKLIEPWKAVFDVLYIHNLCYPQGSLQDMWDVESCQSLASIPNKIQRSYYCWHRLFWDWASWIIIERTLVVWAVFIVRVYFINSNTKLVYQLTLLDDWVLILTLI